jgi:uncharacterized short protein YbdD (DUF466 family)
MKAVLADFRNRFGKLLRSAWRGVRDWSGDSAYERYLKARVRQASREAALSREEFYLEQLQKRYSRPNRCC